MGIKRLVASISAGFDDFVSKVENHEAVADSVIAGIRGSAAKLRVQLARVEREQDALKSRLASSADEQARWRARALQVADTDEGRALECLRRAKASASQGAETEGRLREQAALAEKIRTDLRDIEAELETLKVRRLSLSSRAARADALAPGHHGFPDALDTEAVFDRWETEVLRNEYHSAPVSASKPDELAAEFSAAEEQAELRAELAALRTAPRPPAPEGDSDV